MMGCGGSVKIELDFIVVDLFELVSDWQLVWSDEFDGNVIDINKWIYEVNCVGGGNNE